MNNKLVHFSVKRTLTVFFKIFRYMKPLLLLFFLTSFIWGAQDFVIPYIISHLQATIISLISLNQFGNIINTLLVHLSFLLGYLLLFAISSYCFMMCIESAKKNIWTRMAHSYYDALAPLNSQDAYIRFTSDVNTATISTFNAFNSIIQGTFALVGSLYIVFSVHWILALFAILLGLLNVVVKRKYIPVLEKINKEYRTAEIAVQTNVTDNLANKMTVRLFSLAGIRNHEFNKFLQLLLQINTTKVKVTSQYHLVNQARRWMTYIGVLLLGSILVKKEIIGLSELVLAFGVLPQIVVKIGFLIDILLGYQSAVPSCERVIEALSIPAHPSGKQRLPNSSIEKLIIEDLSFAYDHSARRVLDHITITIKKGEHIALIGPSGTGKSTFLRLLLGLLQPSSGDIIADGVSQTEADWEDWHNHFSYCDQQSSLFPGTIRDMLLMGNQHAEPFDFLEALKKAGADSFVSHRHFSLDEPIWIRDNLQFSGGEQQRLALARALMRKEAIICLDEISSAQDWGIREQLISLIQEELKHNTIILSTNDPTLIRHFDRILKLEDGHIKEYTNHDYRLLLKDKSFHTRLTIKSQAFERGNPKEISQATAAFDKQHSSAGEGRARAMEGTANKATAALAK